MRNGLALSLLALPLLALSLGAGCVARKAPGPSECRAFALASIGLPSSVSAVQLEARPDLEARAEEVTRQCLTTPWDYELLGCVERGAAVNACMRGFQLRKLASARDATFR